MTFSEKIKTIQQNYQNRVQKKIFEDQIDVINKNRKDTVKTEDGRITDNMHHRYFDNEYKDLINSISVYGLWRKDLHLTHFANGISLKNITSRYISKYYLEILSAEKTLMCLIIFNKSMKRLTDIDSEVNMIVQKYEPETKARNDNKERDVSFLNRIKYHFMDYYFTADAVVDLQNNFERNKIDNILNRYSKEEWGPIRKNINQVDMLRNANRTSS